MIRTEAPTKDNKNYKWGVATQGQCTWYAYFRAFEEFRCYPCWWDRATQSGSYANAKDWLTEYRDSWIPKGTDWTPQHGDIIVWTGTCGHVAFVEKNNGDGTCLISQYNMDGVETFSTGNWTIGTVYVGKKARTGNHIGYLHYPISPVTPIERNSNINQVETTESTLRVRTAPSLNASVLGFVAIGYYDVLDQKKADNYTWYEIEEGKWIADITTIYHEGQNPKEDILQKLENIETLTKEIRDLIGG